jgi:hypothetical protein
MAENSEEDWRDLCNAAVEAKDPNELLRIIDQLCQALDRKEQARRVLPLATRVSKKGLTNTASSRGWGNVSC